MNNAVMKYFQPVLFIVALLIYLTPKYASAQQTWTKYINHGFTETANDAVLLPDGSIVIAGSAYFGYAARIDSCGAILWERDFGIQLECQFSGIDYSEQGALFLCGYCSDQTVVYKLDDDGVVEWEFKENKEQFGSGQAIAATYDGGCVITGITEDSTLSDTFVFKLNMNGKVEWRVAYESPDYENGLGIVQDSDGGYYILSSLSYQHEGGSYCRLHRTDNSGNQIWVKDYAGKNVLYETNSLSVTPSGLIAVFGRCANTDDDMILLLDSNGDIVSNKTVTNGRYRHFSLAGACGNDGYMYMSGSTYSRDFPYHCKFFVRKTYPSGTPIWSTLVDTRVTDTENRATRIKAVLPAGNNAYYVVGEFRYDMDIWSYKSDIIVYRGVDPVFDSGVVNSKSPGILSCYPNPSSRFVKISYRLPAGGRVTVRIVSVTGREVETVLSDSPHGPGTATILWDGTTNAGEDAASGVYLCELSVDGIFCHARKILLFK